MTTTGRTHNQHEHPQTATTSRPDGDRSRSAVARIQPVLSDFTEAWLELGRQITASLSQLRPAAEALQKAGLLLDEPPTDLKARALWLRQHRNTGPAQRQRAPRHLDTTARRRTR